MDHCSTCRFWNPTDWIETVNPGKVATYGECRFKAPVVVSRPNGNATVFPQTSPDCGCGDHEKKP